MNTNRAIGASVVQINQQKISTAESGLTKPVWDVQSIWLDNGWSIVFTVEEGDTDYYVTAQLVNRKAKAKK